MVSMPSSDNGDHIERTERELYSQNGGDHSAEERQTLEDEAPDVQQEWYHERKQKAKRSRQKDSAAHPLFVKVFIAALVFFVIAVGVSGYLFYSGSLMVSGEKVALEVSGPVSVGAGETVDLDVFIANQNQVALQNAELTAQFASNARDPEEPTQQRGREQISLGTIEPDEQVRRSFSTLLLGEEGASSSVRFTLEYGIANSNARLVSSKKHSLTLGSSPVSVSIDSPTEVNADQEVSFDIMLTNNVNKPVEGLLLKSSYPSDFIFRRADPSPLEDQSVWDIGTMEPQESRTITVTGIMQSQPSEERTFRFRLGQRTGAATNIDSLFAKRQRTLKIREPYLGLDVSVGEYDPEQFSAEPGEPVSVNVALTNNMPVRALNSRISLKPSGNVFDPDKVQINSGEGFYRSVNDTVVWNRDTDSRLQALSSGGQYKAGATIGTLRFGQEGKTLTQMVNPHLDVDIDIEADQRSRADLPDTVSASRSYRLKMNTVPSLEARTLYGTGPFETSGPIPPTVDQRTTYNVRLTAKNTYNSMEETVVFGALPSYVQWTGQKNRESLTFNPTTRTFRWEVGELQRQAGNGRPSRTAAFQVGIRPSVNQQGQTPTLVQNIRMQGTDQYTGSTLRVDANKVTTKISPLPGFSQSDDAVVE